LSIIINIAVEQKKKANKKICKNQKTTSEKVKNKKKEIIKNKKQL